MYSEFASSCDHQLHDGKTCQKSFFNVLTRGLCIYLQFYFEFRDRGNFALQMSFNNCNCTLPPNWETSVVEAPEHSQVVSTTWPLVGTTCPVGTEYTISPSIAKSTCYRSKISAANRQFSACKELYYSQYFASQSGTTYLTKYHTKFVFNDQFKRGQSVEMGGSKTRAARTAVRHPVRIAAD